MSTESEANRPETREVLGKPANLPGDNTERAASTGAGMEHRRVRMHRRRAVTQMIYCKNRAKVADC